MTFIQNLIDRQLGNCCWFSYDNVLKRLMVDSEENYYGLMNSELARLTGPLEHDPPIFACRFSEAPGCEHILALANENGRVAIQNTYSASTASSFDGFQCHNDAVFDLVWMPGHMKFVTVSADHTACLWDAGGGGGGGAPRRLAVFSHHTKSVKTAAFRPRDGAVFATGARDGRVLLWDARVGPAPTAALVLRPDNCLAGCHAARPPPARAKRPRPPAPRAASITGLAFRDADTLVSCGENDGNIKLWDLRKSYHAHTREPLPKHSIPYCGSSTKNGYTNLIVDEARGRLYASCMDDVIYCFNVAAAGPRPLQRYVGHENSTFYIKAALSADGAYLASGSSDHHAYVWNVEYPEPVVRLAGHRAEVTCAAWGARGALLATAGDDARHRLWRVGPERGAGDPPGRGGDAGRALPAPRPRAASPPRWRADTPTAAAAPPDGKRLKRPDAAVGKTKRRLVDLMTATGGEDEPGAAKRLCPEVPADAATEVSLLPAGVKRRWSGVEPAPSPGARRTPPRTPPRRSPRGSPAASPRRSPRLTPPTAGLPDWVCTGEAPHLRLMSPLKRKAGTPDWLTLLARGKRARVEAGVPPPVPPEGAAGESPREPPSTRPPREDAARGAASAEKTSRPGYKNKPLLKYFTVKNKNN